MKTTLILILILMICEPVSAQISVGLSIGNNFSRITNNTDYKKYPDLIEPDKQEYSITNGLIVGIPIELNLTNNLSLLTTLSFIQKGTEFNSKISFTDFYTVEGSGTSKYNYLELPIQAKLNILNKKTNVYFMAGPSVGYLISDRGIYTAMIHNTELGEVTREDVDNKRKFKDLENSGLNRIDIGLAIGVGCDYYLSTGKIFLNLNYLNGLTNMLKQGDGFANGTNQQNRGFTATIGYIIPITKHHQQ